MRRISKLSVLCLAAGVVSACVPDEIIPTTAIPTAGVRFINAVPDTGMMDFGFYDIVENSRHFQIAFRNTPVIAPTGANGIPASTTVQYKPAQAGSRKFRIFMDGTTAAVASTVVKDTTVTLEAGKNYTVLLWGYANPTGPGRPASAPAMALKVIEESVADPGATKAAIRIINATMNAVDASHYANGSAVPVVPAAAWTNIAGMTIGAYEIVDTAITWYKVTNVGAHAVASTLFADRRAILGAKAVTVAPGPFDAEPGTQVAGSAVTGIVFPASVAGSGAPQGAGSSTIPAWTSPAITFVWDRRPPRPAGI